MGQSFTGTFPAGDGHKIFVVYGKVVFGKDDKGFLDEIASQEIIVESATSYSEKEGLTGMNTSSPTLVFKIGGVSGSKEGLTRAVFVTQLQSGPKILAPSDSPLWSSFDQNDEAVILGGPNAADVKILKIVDDTGTRVNIDIDDLPTEAVDDDGVELREVKVCNNGVPATAYILMSKPVNDP